MEPDPVYYRIYLEREGKLRVVCMQDFYEHNYDEHRFYRGDDGERARFDTMEEARKFLNDTFKAEFIDPDDLTPNNKDLFERMKRTN